MVFAGNLVPWAFILVALSLLSCQSTASGKTDEVRIVSLELPDCKRKDDGCGVNPCVRVKGPQIRHPPPTKPPPLYHPPTRPPPSCQPPTRPPPLCHPPTKPPPLCHPPTKPPPSCHLKPTHPKVHPIAPPPEPECEESVVMPPHKDPSAVHTLWGNIYFCSTFHSCPLPNPLQMFFPPQEWSASGQLPYKDKKIEVPSESIEYRTDFPNRLPQERVTVEGNHAQAAHSLGNIYHTYGHENHHPYPLLHTDYAFPPYGDDPYYGPYAQEGDDSYYKADTGEGKGPSESTHSSPYTTY